MTLTLSFAQLRSAYRSAASKKASSGLRCTLLLLPARRPLELLYLLHDVILNDKVALQDIQVWGLPVARGERLLARREVGLVAGGVVQDAYAHVFALLEIAVGGPRPARRPDLTDQPSFVVASNGQAKDGPPDVGVVVRNVRIAGIRDGERALRVVGVSPRRLGVYPQPRRTELATQLPFPVDLVHYRVGLRAAT